MKTIVLEQTTAINICRLQQYRRQVHFPGAVKTEIRCENIIQCGGVNMTSGERDPKSMCRFYIDIEPGSPHWMHDMVVEAVLNRVEEERKKLIINSGILTKKDFEQHLAEIGT